MSIALTLDHADTVTVRATSYVRTTTMAVSVRPNQIMASGKKGAVPGSESRKLDRPDQSSFPPFEVAHQRSEHRSDECAKHHAFRTAAGGCPRRRGARSPVLGHADESSKDIFQRWKTRRGSFAVMRGEFPSRAAQRAPGPMATAAFSARLARPAISRAGKSARGGVGWISGAPGSMTTPLASGRAVQLPRFDAAFFRQCQIDPFIQVRHRLEHLLAQQ